MRIGFVSIRHRSNTFARHHASLVLSPWPHDNHRQDGDANSILPGVESDGIELVPLVMPVHSAGGPIGFAAFSTLLAELETVLAQQDSLDGLILEVSGTLLVEGHSGELLLLRRLVERFPSLFVGILADQVAQLPEAVFGLTPLVLGPHHWPAIDRAQRLALLVRLLARWIRREITPVATLERRTVLLPLAIQRTDCPPFDRLPQLLAAVEQDPSILAVTIFPGFPYADVAQAGMTVVVVTDTAAELGKATARQLADFVWDRREEIAWPTLTIEETLHQAMQNESTGPHLILDAGDATEAGAPGEGTAALWAALDLGARQALLSAIVDPEAIEIILRHGVGTPIELELGGKTDHRHGYPIPVRGIVRRISRGQYRRWSPLAGGELLDAGPSAWLEIEGRYESRLDVIVTTRPVPFDELGLARALGIAVETKRIIILKSAVEALAWCHQSELSTPPVRPAKVLQAVTPGITTPDLGFFSYRSVMRPAWPLDAY
ncbi:M81 family metallopeptidase [Thermomicrobium sp.]